jgi:hypothetical protein
MMLSSSIYISVPGELSSHLSFTKNVGLFSNLELNYHISGTEYALDPSRSTAWGFYFGSGFQDGEDFDKCLPHYAWAVRDGDVALAPIPASV